MDTPRMNLPENNPQKTDTISLWYKKRCMRSYPLAVKICGVSVIWRFHLKLENIRANVKYKYTRNVYCSETQVYNLFSYSC